LSQTIKKDEHVFICGSTGCGKTVLANCYLSNTLHRTFVLDTKGTFKWFKAQDKTSIFTRDINKIESLNKGILNQQKFKKIHKIIYRSTGPDLTQENLNRFFQYIYHLGNSIVYIDEIAQCCKGPLKFPVYMQYLYQQGRELGISVWGSTQRPRHIANFCMTEATHFFIFRMNAMADRKKVSEDCSNDVFKEKLSGHYFRYWRGDKDIDPVTSILKL